jgi:outer membrane phospholipase A
MNILYVKPIFTFGDPGNHANPKGDWFISIAPRAWIYLKDPDPEDLKSFRGYGDLRVVLGERGGVQLAMTGRIGEGLEHGALQFDVSCPLSRVGIKNPDLYLYGQYFVGYGESLREYNESGSSIRVGLALVR